MAHLAVARQLAPAVGSSNQSAQRNSTFAPQPLFGQQQPCALKQGHPIGAGHHLDFLLRFVPKPAFRRIDDALERQIVIRAGHKAEIPHGVANFHPFIKPRATDHPIRQTDG